MKAGFIGLGTMGASMAANLLKGIQKDGHTLLVHDVRKEAAAQHLRDGATWADSTAQATVTYNYWLVEVAKNGTSTTYGPVRMNAPAVQRQNTIFLPMTMR